MPNPTFVQLNPGWNAEPDAPTPGVTIHSDAVRSSFVLNSFAHEAETDEVACLTFRACSRCRLGSTDDEGWYRGQCRYSGVAPSRGEFHEVSGEDDRRPEPGDWHDLGAPSSGARHFLFYLRDNIFECFASGWSFERFAAPA